LCIVNLGPQTSCYGRWPHKHLMYSSSLLERTSLRTDVGQEQHIHGVFINKYVGGRIRESKYTTHTSSRSSLVSDYNVNAGVTRSCVAPSRDCTRHDTDTAIVSCHRSTRLVTRTPQCGQAVSLPYVLVTLWCCTICRMEWFADRKHTSAEDTLCNVPRTHRLSFI